MGCIVKGSYENLEPSMLLFDKLKNISFKLFVMFEDHKNNFISSNI